MKKKPNMDLLFTWGRNKCYIYFNKFSKNIRLIIFGIVKGRAFKTIVLILLILLIFDIQNINF